MAIHLIDATLKPKRKSKFTSPFAFSSEDRYMVIRLPNSKFNKMCYCFMLFALAFASFLFVIRSSLFHQQNLLSSSTTPSYQPRPFSTDIHQVMSNLFHDFTNEGFMKKTQYKAVFLCSDITEAEFPIHVDYNMEVVHLNDIDKQKSVLDNTVDFVFTSDFGEASRFIQRALKINGIVTVLLNNKASTAFSKPSNYKIVYMRRFDTVAVAMKKTGEAVVDTLNLAAPRKLCGYASEAKKAALQKLEDVLLEPPRAASGKSRKYLKRTKYLPDLMDDSLESYSRRVFIDVGLPEKDGGSGTDWFLKNYPTRNKNFEIYKIEAVTEEPSGKEVPQNGMSDWLRKNVKEEEYVVMKADAEVAEEMMKSNSIGLVDELFLECMPKKGKRLNRNPRAYWECLALYGKLRDKGVAVHQWWGY